MPLLSAVRAAFSQSIRIASKPVPVSGGTLETAKHRGLLSREISPTATPKPSAEGSSPSAPAKQDAVRMDGVLLGIERYGGPEALGECRARAPSAAGGGRSEGRAAQRSKSASGLRPRRAFRAPQEGLFKSFCPCQQKALAFASAFCNEAAPDGANEGMKPLR